MCDTYYYYIGLSIKDLDGNVLFLYLQKYEIIGIFKVILPYFGVATSYFALRFAA